MLHDHDLSLTLTKMRNEKTSDHKTLLCIVPESSYEKLNLGDLLTAFGGRRLHYVSLIVVSSTTAQNNWCTGAFSVMIVTGKLLLPFYSQIKTAVQQILDRAEYC